MKYIVNEQNTCGQASLTDDLRNTVLESLGFAPNESAEQINESVVAGAEVENEEYDAPCLYEWDNSVFALEEEVYEIDGQLFLKAFELDAELRGSLDESHEELFINEVRFEREDFSLGDIYDYGDEIFIALTEGDKKGDKSKDKPEDKPDYTTDARKGDKGHGKDKDDKGDYETGMRKGDKSNQKSKEGDKPDFTTDMRKGDKSKTHPGRKDFENGKKKVDEQMNAADRLKAFNKNKAGSGDTATAQATAQRRTSELKARTKAQNSDTKADTAQAEKDAARDAGM